MAAARLGAASGAVMPLVRGCRNRWCPEYGGPDGWCETHRPLPYRHVRAPMGPGWDGIRAAQLAAYPTCQECGQAPATDVHHVIPRSAGGGNEPGNLRSLCHPCHARITGQEGGASWP